MKRSEALNIVADHLVPCDYELANRILKALEEAGIYPPCRKDGKYEWEPEDETLP